MDDIDKRKTQMKASADYQPELWGNATWKFLHFMALGYSNKPTDRNKRHYKEFVERLQYILPCHECRTNFSKHLKKYPIDPYLKNSHTLFEWIVKIQNETKNSRKVNKEYLKKYYVNENRKIVMKNCCGLEKKSERLVKKIYD